MSHCRSVVYKEQVRLNQAAANALMARLEAQKAICDSSERELHKKFKQRDELEKQIRPEWEQARKRSRMDEVLAEEKKNGKAILCLPGNETNNEMQMTVSNPLISDKDEMNAYLQRFMSKIPHKELRKYLEEEQRASEAVYACKGKGLEEQEELPRDLNNGIIPAADDNTIEQKHHSLGGVGESLVNLHFPPLDEPEIKEDEESRKERGKGNVEKWLQMLLEDAQKDVDLNLQTSDERKADRSDEIIRKLDLVYPQKELKISKDTNGLDQVDDQQLISAKDVGKREEEIVETEGRKLSYSSKKGDEKRREIAAATKYRDTPTKNPPYRLKSEKTKEEPASAAKGMENRQNNVGNESKEKIRKEKELHRSESARTFRRIPSSPSLIFSGMKKRVDCIGKKPLVNGDDEENHNHIGENSLIKSTIKTIKRAVKF